MMNSNFLHVVCEMPIEYLDAYIQQAVGICCLQEMSVLEIRIQESRAGREYLKITEIGWVERRGSRVRQVESQH